MSGTSGYNLENDPAVEKLLVFCLLPAAVSGAIGFFLPQVRGWLLMHSVIVAPAHATLTLPGGLGLDGPRIACALFVMLALVGIAMTSHAARVLKQES